ncbi:1-deoxy-D-xylulose-5-phosphate reductoisomerase [Bowdeniella massiliensis]|uniref:1-deoxy-D-xylulose-5-phosphate reductoisomerase n=1 Tax=Bowdeniella massiliensis TaxID=2932264 RepID=UPI002029712A
MAALFILGATGSIGTQALDVARAEQMSVAGLAAGGANLELLVAQTAEFTPEVIAIADERGEAELRSRLAEAGAGRTFAAPDILIGAAAAAELAGRAQSEDTVLNGITGSIGLPATLSALATGARLALANKESLVVGGALVAEAMTRPGQIVPVDSEHSAMFQALAAGTHHRGLCSENLDGESNVARLVLTASGGPFRGKTRAELGDVTPEQALAHPTWDMGPVVTINSSTLMNKGLELIEAQLLFDVDAANIDVIVHPQSIVHSMVTFVDGSTIAQTSPPNMRLPIALALTWPQRTYPAPACQWDAPTNWTFEPVDTETFPATELARAAVAASPTHPAVLNAANEACVAQFLSGNIAYLAIVDTVSEVLAAHRWDSGRTPSLDDLAELDAWARREASERLSACHT